MSDAIRKDSSALEPANLPRPAWCGRTNDAQACAYTDMAALNGSGTIECGKMPIEGPDVDPASRIECTKALPVMDDRQVAQSTASHGMIGKLF